MDVRIKTKSFRSFLKIQKIQIGDQILSPVDINEITTYIRPDAKMSGDWNELPDDIKGTFDALGIPEAEYKRELSGVGAQYDSEVVYHSLTEKMKIKE